MTPARAVLTAATLYGVVMVLAGASLVRDTVSPAGSSAGADAAAVTVGPNRGPASSIAPAPSVQPSDVPLAAPPVPASGSPSPPPPAERVEDARVATAAPGQPVTFVPTVLTLPSGTRAAIRPVSVTSDGALTIPPNPLEVGIWTGGAKAGAPLGSLVLAGHVDSAQFGLGVLHELKSVRPGAVIRLTAPGRATTYRVSATRTVNQQSLATDDEFFRQDVAARLVLITCGGPFDLRTHRYRDNVIVLADPL